MSARHLRRLGGAIVASFLLSGHAWAGPWAGVPLDVLPSLSLTHLTLDEQDSRWQAASPDGFVRVVLHADEATADAAFDQEVLMAAAVTLPEVTLAGADEARGHVGDLLVFRSRNVVVTVVDRSGQASVVAGRVVASLVEAAPEGVYRSKVVAGTTLTWDAVGRLSRR